MCDILHVQRNTDDIHSSPNIIRVIKCGRMRWAGHIACMPKKNNGYSVLAGKPEGKRSFVRPRCRWELNCKMDIEVGRGSGLYMLDLSGSGCSQVAKCCESHNDCSCSITCVELLSRPGYVSFSSRTQLQGFV